jgi:hypothetical protein
VVPFDGLSCLPGPCMSCFGVYLLLDHLCLIVSCWDCLVVVIFARMFLMFVWTYFFWVDAFGLI